MRFNVTIDDAKFFIDEEKKTVVCVIDDTENLFRDFAITNFHICTDCDQAYNFINRIHDGESTLDEKMLMPNRFVGIAHCSENDEWDEKIGRTVAFSRAKDNLLKSFFKRAATYENFVADAAEQATVILDELWNKFESNTEHRYQYIEELIVENTNAK